MGTPLRRPHPRFGNLLQTYRNGTLDSARFVHRRDSRRWFKACPTQTPPARRHCFDDPNGMAIHHPIESTGRPAQFCAHPTQAAPSLQFRLHPRHNLGCCTSSGSPSSPARTVLREMRSTPPLMILTAAGKTQRYFGVESGRAGGSVLFGDSAPANALTKILMF